MREGEKETEGVIRRERYYEIWEEIRRKGKLEESEKIGREGGEEQE